MPALPFSSRVLVALLISLGALTAGAVLHAVPLSIAGAALFAAAIIASAVSSETPPKPGAALDLARHHTLLAALSYAWAAAGFAAVYSLSDLVWYHAYQYGIGAFLFAFGLFLLYRRMGATDNATPPSIVLTALHAAAAAGGLAYLFGTGKLMSQRTDWPGNIIFAAGGITIVALCIIAIRAQTKLGKDGA